MLIIFDWDGTLADSRDHIVAALQASVCELGFGEVTDEQCADKIGLGLRQAVAGLYPGIEEAAITLFCKTYSAAFLSLSKSDFPLQLFDGVENTLEKLRHQGHQLAVATGKSRQGLNRVLGTSSLAGFFSATRTADETVSKPDPLMLTELLTETGNHPQNAMMVGDTSYDLDMARKAQVAGVGVLCGVHNEQTLLNCDPMAVLNTVADLPESLTEIQRRFVK